MEAQKINMLELIDGKRVFSIPVYQRNYDWKISNCKRLFNDIEKIAKDDKETVIFLELLFMWMERKQLILENL